ncbi:MAG: hypothetical protein ACTSR3_15855 [Candidatus Helarchaeota archaeon]
MIKGGFCSNIRLGFRFKHMTVKKHLEYEKKLLNYWNQLMNECKINNLDVLFIIGNLFNNPNPKNQSIKMVAQKLKDLTDFGIQIFIMPGPLDTPLFHSDDISPHDLLNMINDVFILIPPPEKNMGYEIKDPLIQTHITHKENGKNKKKAVEIFGPSSGLFDPQELLFNFRGDPNKISVMSLYGEITLENDLSKFKDKFLRVSLDTLIKLNDCKIDLLLIGGLSNVSKNELMKHINYNLIICPPAFPYDFNYDRIQPGIQIEDLEKIPNLRVSKLISFKKYNIKQKIISVTGKDPDDINKIANNIITSNLDPHNGYFQLRLEGVLPRSIYQKIDIFELVERGRKTNYYFELDDRISFSDKTDGIGGLHPLKFIETLVQTKINNLNEETEGKNLDEDNKAEVLEQALSKIKSDWTELQ